VTDFGTSLRSIKCAFRLSFAVQVQLFMLLPVIAFGLSYVIAAAAALLLRRAGGTVGWRDLRDAHSTGTFASLAVTMLVLPTSIGALARVQSQRMERWRPRALQRRKRKTRRGARVLRVRFSRV
jgi:hypothetical protein